MIPNDHPLKPDFDAYLAEFMPPAARTVLENSERLHPAPQGESVIDLFWRTFLAGARANARSSAKAATDRG